MLCLSSGLKTAAQSGNHDTAVYVVRHTAVLGADRHDDGCSTYDVDGIPDVEW